MNTQPNAQTRLHLRAISLEERRGDRILLVWGDSGQWLVVDSELRTFLALFDGRRQLRAVLRHHARQQGLREREVEADALPLVRSLMDRDILTIDPAPRLPEPEAPSLANVTVNLTNHCNLRCTWCYNADRRTPEIPVSRMMAAFAESRALFSDNASLIVLGGEPFTAPERLFELVSLARGPFTSPVLVSTNGTLLTEDLARRLADAGVDVQVSLDSPHPERHDAVRGEGVFARAVRGIGHLKRHGVPVTLSMVYNRDNTGEFEDYLDLALSLDVNEVRFIPLRRMGRALDCPALAPDQEVAFLHLLDALERRPEARRLLRRDYFTITETVCRYSSRRTNCGIGRKVVFVDADGAVYPCPNHVRPEYCAGNIRDRALGDLVLHSPVFASVREDYQVRRFDDCPDCPFRYWCAGDCRGEVLALTGSRSAPSPHCAELKRLFVRLLWLLADQDGFNPASIKGGLAIDGRAC